MIKAFLALIILSFFLPQISFAEEKNVIKLDLNTNGRNVFYLNQSPTPDKINLWYKIEKFDPQINPVTIKIELKKLGKTNPEDSIYTITITTSLGGNELNDILIYNVVSSGALPPTFEKGIYIFTIKFESCKLSGSTPCTLDTETVKVDNAKSVVIMVKEKKTPVPEIDPLLVLLIPFGVIFILSRKKTREKLLAG
jgi:hypothetical protein